MTNNQSQYVKEISLYTQDLKGILVKVNLFKQVKRIPCIKH